jgi:hypothetical protein
MTMAQGSGCACWGEASEELYSTVLDPDFARSADVIFSISVERQTSESRSQRISHYDI